MQISMKRVAGMALVLVAGLSFVAVRVEGDDPAITAETTTDTASVTTPVTDAQPTVKLPPGEPAMEPPAAPVIKVSQGAGEVAKLAQSGVGDDVMLAYIGNAKNKFNLGSDQIVYLNDLGVSASVVKAMIQRDATLDANSRAALDNLLSPPTDTTAVPPVPPLAPEETPAPQLPDDGTMPPPMVEENPGDYSTPDDSGYFYNSLAPYGSWIYVAGTGLCWQPTVYVGNRDWRPYCDRGRWLYSDCGWYWHSDYSWGWAAFHYGRWFCDANRGWVWVPNRVWGPAWVSWRHGNDYCGWAPLPPAARFMPGRGFTYANHPVPANFEFGLHASHYLYIPVERMSDYSPSRYAVPPWEAGDVHGQTTVANHFTTEHNHVVNRSIDPREVASVSQVPVRYAEVREMPVTAGRMVPPDRLAKSGNSLVIYRPQLPATTTRSGTGVGHGARAGGATPSFANRQRSLAATAANVQEGSHGENYPAGSLVLSGAHPGNNVANNSAAASLLPNMVLPRQPGSEGPTYNQAVYVDRGYIPPSSVTYPKPVVHNEVETGRPVAGFNFNDYPVRGSGEATTFQPHPVTGQAQSPGQSVYIINGRYTGTQQINRSAAPNTVAEANYSRPGNYSEAAAAHAPSIQAQSSGRADVANSYRAAAAASVPHSAPAPAPAAHAASSGGSNSGKKQ